MPGFIDDDDDALSPGSSPIRDKPDDQINEVTEPEPDPELVAYKSQKAVWTAVTEWTEDELVINQEKDRLLDDAGITSRWSKFRGNKETANGHMESYYCPKGGRSKHCLYSIRLLVDNSSAAPRFLLEWNNIDHRHVEYEESNKQRLQPDIRQACDEGYHANVSCLILLTLLILLCR